MIRLVVEIKDRNMERSMKFLLDDMKLDSNAAQLLMRDISNLLRTVESPVFNMNLPTSQVAQSLELTGLSLQCQAPLHTLIALPAESGSWRRKDEAKSES